MSKSPIDEIEDLLGIPITERLLKATAAVLLSGRNTVDAADIFGLDRYKLEQHVKWFKALQNFTTDGSPYDKQTKHDFINQYYKKYGKPVPR